MNSDCRQNQIVVQMMHPKPAHIYPNGDVRASECLLFGLKMCLSDWRLVRSQDQVHSEIMRAAQGAAGVHNL